MSHDIPRHQQHNASQESNPFIWTDVTEAMREAGVSDDAISAFVSNNQANVKAAYEMLDYFSKKREENEMSTQQPDVLEDEEPVTQRLMGGAALKDFGRVAGSIDTPPENSPPRVEYTQPHFPSSEGQDVSANAIRELNRIRDLENRRQR